MAEEPGRQGDAGSAGRGGRDPVGEMAQRFAEISERLQAMATPAFPAGRWPGGDPQAMVRAAIAQASLPLNQLESFLGEIGARRKQLRTLRDQLAAFDEQLEAMESTLTPLVEWGRTWTRLQRALLEPFGGEPTPGAPRAPSPGRPRPGEGE